MSYKFTGVPIDQLHQKIDPIIQILNRYGTAYCNLYSDLECYNTKMIMLDALSHLDNCNYFIILVDDKIGEGMMIEFGYAFKMKLPILLLIGQSVHSNSIESLSENIIEFENFQDLYPKLEKFFQSESLI